jgi:hypothetical protein
LAELSPSILARRWIWAGRPVDHKEQGRERSPRPARAPPPHAQPRTSPPCAPSQGSAFLPGKKKVPARPPPLKGAALPLPPHPSYPGSALSPRHLSGAPKGLDFPSPPLVSLRKRRLGCKMDWMGGAGGGICPAALLRLLPLLKRPIPARSLRQSQLDRSSVGTARGWLGCWSRLRSAVSP